MSLYNIAGITKVLVPKAAVERVSQRAHARGEVLSQEELEDRAGLEVRELPSEKEEAEPVPQKLYGCMCCDRTFTTPGGLRSHEMWMHPGPRRTAVVMPACPFKGVLSAPLTVEDGVVRVTVLINGKDRAQLEAEELEAVRQWEAAKAEREAEQHRRRTAAQEQRDREEAVDHRQQRRGSAHRHSYNPVEKLRLIDLLDEIYANPTVENKSHEFESDSRSKGVSFTTAVKWLKPHARREIRKAAAQDHAKRLLRIDTKSRRNGKYVPMEKELFRLFRLRRARARKTSSKCVQPAM
jgi:hypothetical protein